jgi:hypothetical protein
MTALALWLALVEVAKECKGRRTWYLVASNMSAGGRRELCGCEPAGKSNQRKKSIFLGVQLKQRNERNMHLEIATILSRFICIWPYYDAYVFGNSHNFIYIYMRSGLDQKLALFCRAS